MLETRVPAFKSDVQTLREYVAVILSNCGTKANINELVIEFHSLPRIRILWSVGSIITTAFTIISLMTV